MMDTIAAYQRHNLALARAVATAKDDKKLLAVLIAGANQQLARDLGFIR